jgi:hypothetical protein
MTECGCVYERLGEYLVIYSAAHAALKREIEFGNKLPNYDYRPRGETMAKHDIGTTVRDILDCRGCAYLRGYGLPWDYVFRDHVKDIMEQEREPTPN